MSANPEDSISASKQSDLAKKNPHTTRPLDVSEVRRLAELIWEIEGAIPGLETRYKEEIALQLRATRHLLERDLTRRRTAVLGRKTRARAVRTG